MTEHLIDKHTLNVTVRQNQHDTVHDKTVPHSILLIFYFEGPFTHQHYHFLSLSNTMPITLSLSSVMSGHIAPLQQRTYSVVSPYTYTLASQLHA